MQRMVLSLAALTMFLGCSRDRERRAVATPDTTRQALVPVTADTLVSRAQEAASPSAKRLAGRARPAKPRHRPSATRPTPRVTAPDTLVSTDSAPSPSAGYAPERDTLPPAPRDSTQVRDTAARQSAESTQPRPVDIGSAPAPAPENAHTLAPGTEVRAVLSDSIDSRSDSAGQVVLARVSGDITDPSGIPVIPAGSEVQLTITRLEPARSRSASDGKLSLRVDAVTLDGNPVPTKGTVQPVPHELRGRGITAGEMEKVGVGTAAGAVAGRVITGRTKGAVVGGVVGAAGGAVVAAQTASRDVVVHSGTTVVFTLSAPLVASVP
ncbi:MAG: hypothetical protein ACJ8DC_16405 [Gemmatimonadales bacterium]